jgi:hypothetical protein
MEDLLVFAADADIGAFVGSVLQRPEAVGISHVTVDIIRHPLRDSGMVQSGPELARMKKGFYRKVVLMWDHHGSGRERRDSPQQVASELCSRLDDASWTGNRAAVVLVPELEQWLWHAEAALAAHWGIASPDLEDWVSNYAKTSGKPVEQVKRDQPKELFEHIAGRRLRRTVSPRDFAEIGRRASIPALMACDTFETLVQTLRAWFPAIQ